MFDFLIVGSGLAGSVCAEQLANAGNEVVIIDKRNHIAGNTYDFTDTNNLLVHKYGPHIFHTDDKVVYKYLSNFTDWHSYEHRVLSYVDGKYLPFPISRITINKLYNKNFDINGFKLFIKNQRVELDKIGTGKDYIISQVGYELYEKFFKNYTKKQWDLYPDEIDSSILSRIPIRWNDDTRYFTDKYQGIPKDGYTSMVKNILDNKNIHIELEKDFFSYKKTDECKYIIYTGPIDKYFNNTYGKLNYRSIHFEHRKLGNNKFFQKVGTVNYPNDFAYTRITEFKHLTGQKSEKTSIVYEFPTRDGDPYYPVINNKNITINKKYNQLKEKQNNTFFIGRLAQYKYLNMDQVVREALDISKKIIEITS